MPAKFMPQEEIPIMPATPDKGSSDPVEEIKRFIGEIPQEEPRGLLASPPTKEELDRKVRYERMGYLLRIVQLRLSTMGYLGSANDYITQIGKEDATISRAFNVVIAAEALQDIVDIHSDLGLLRSEARKLYKDAGTDLAPDALSQTLSALATMVQSSVAKSELAKPKES
jgi:hypothetical protein